MNKELVVKSNQVIEASYRLTLSEQRLILLCVEQIKKGQVVSVSDRFEISAQNFAKRFNISTDRAYSDLMEVTDKLYERSVTVYNPDPDDPRIAATKTRWISSIDYIPGEGCVVVRFASRMIPYIAMLDGNFTRYNLEHIAEMGSIYGIRFYEFFQCWLMANRKGSKTMELEELKEKLELTGKYPSIKDFKLKVLDRGIQDINEHSDLGARYETLKTGRRITHIKFNFWVKKDAKPKTQKRYTKTDLEKEPTLARPGESYEQALKRLNTQNGKLGTKEEQTEINLSN